ncbi:MAG: hypothetical protein U0791_22540 [Gemmataceae bacterium]
MKSTLKILVPIALLLGGVFVLTYFAQYTPREEEDKGGPEVVSSKKPLQFFTSRRAWIPREFYDKAVASGDAPPPLLDTIFPGFYEPGVEHNSAAFWFKSDSSVPVTIQLQRVSCVTCSGGRVAAIPPAVADQILQMTALSTLPQGFASGLPAGMAGAAANLDPARLPWQYHKFDKPAAEVKYEVPAAPGAGHWCAEQWAVLDLQFQAKSVPGLHSLHARFRTQRQGEAEGFDEEFAIGYVTANPFEVDKTSIETGELTDASASQTHEVLVFSSTRSNLGEMQLNVTMPPGVGGEPGPFVSAGQPVAVPESKHLALMEKISTTRKEPVRFRSAFTVPITIRTKVGDKKLDFGRLERNVTISLGNASIPVHVTGSMRGPVYLVGAKEMAFGYFSYADEQSVTVTVESERKGDELQLLADLTQPKFLKVELKRQPDIGDRGVYKLKAVLPAKEQLGEIKDGVVVLETKGPNPLRLRIPVTGRGR